MEPIFRKDASGALILQDSAEARSVKREHREKNYQPPKSAQAFRADAEKSVKLANGDLENPKHLLGQCRIQFGQFRGMTFKWILENSPGYAGYLVGGMEKDKPGSDSQWINKMALKKYVLLFPEGNEAIRRKKVQPTIPVTSIDVGQLTDDQLLADVEAVESRLKGSHLLYHVEDIYFFNEDIL